MGAKLIKPEELGIELAKIVKEYTADVAEGIDKEVDKAAKEIKEEVQALAPRDRPKYYKGFAIKTDRSSGEVTKIIYNKSLPGLVHLKEMGHAKRNRKGRVAGKPHMRPAYDKVAPKLEKNIEKIIRNGG